MAPATANPPTLLSMVADEAMFPGPVMLASIEAMLRAFVDIPVIIPLN